MKTKITKIILLVSLFALVFSFNAQKTDAGVNDGLEWTEVTASADWPGRSDHCALVYNNMFWVMGGYAVSGEVGDEVNDVWYSSDGENWTQATANAAWSDRYTFPVLFLMAKCG